MNTHGTNRLLDEVIANKEVPPHIALFVCAHNKKLPPRTKHDAVRYLADIMVVTRNSSIRRRAKAYMEQLRYLE